MKLNKTMKNEAVVKILRSKYLGKVNKMEKKLKNFVVDYYTNLPKSKEATEWFNELPMKFKKHVRYSTEVRASYYNNKNTYSMFYIYINTTVGKDFTIVFNSKNTSSYVSLPFPAILEDLSKLPTDKSIKLQKEKDDLQNEIEVFKEDLLSALSCINTSKQLEKTFPHLVKFFDVPTKGTQLIDKDLQDKINALTVNI